MKSTGDSGRCCIIGGVEFWAGYGKGSMHGAVQLDRHSPTTTAYMLIEYGQLFEQPGHPTQHMRKLQIRFWLIVLAWFLYGQMIAGGLSAGYLNNIGVYAWEAFRQYIPSIARLHESYEILPRLHSSLMLMSMPFLFIALLLTDVEGSVEGVRKKGTEVPATIFIILIGSMVFVAGFGARRFNGSFFTFSIGASFLTAVSAYCFRAAYCIVFQTPHRPSHQESPGRPGQ